MNLLLINIKTTLHLMTEMLPLGGLSVVFILMVYGINVL